MERSKLEELFPLEQLPLPEELTLVTVSPEETGAMIEKLREDHLAIRPTEAPVERGDFVLLAPPEGGELRLINTARPMGAAALAEACLGRRVGEVLPEAGTVASVRRRFLPDFDSALVQAAGIPGVSTPEDYRAHCLETLRQRKVKRQTRALAGALAQSWVSHCRFQLDSGEREAAAAELEAMIQKGTAEAGWSREDALKMLARMLELQEEALSMDACVQALLHRTLLGEHLLAQYGVHLDRDRYEKALAKAAQEQGSEAESLRPFYPYVLFCHEKASVQIDTEVKKFIQERKPFRYA